MAWNKNGYQISEDQLQVQCFTWVRAQYPQLEKRIYHIPNGGQRNKLVAFNLKRQGTLAGVWDIYVSIPRKGFHGAYIELKVGKNKLTDKQVAFQQANANDYHFAVCYTLDEFQQTIKEYLT